MPTSFKYRRHYTAWFAFAQLGAIVCLAPSAQAQTAVLTTLGGFNFGNGGANPRDPYGDLVLVGDTLYGTTEVGGSGLYGTIFSESISGGAPTILGNLNFDNGSNPYGSLVVVGSNLYGTTYLGGDPNYNGTIFTLPLTGGTPVDIAAPATSIGTVIGPNLTLSSDGTTLYTSAAGGGANGDGSIISEPVAGGAPTVLGSFNGSGDGEAPDGDLVLSGNTLYGITEAGGASNDGTVFSEPVAGGTPTLLATFNGTNGLDPEGDLVLIGDTLYGTTSRGGTASDGSIYSVPITGGPITTLFSFDQTDGFEPESGLQYINGLLYGTTFRGGTYNDGTIFSIAPTGGSITTLINFNGTDGQLPVGDLIYSGNTFYGTTSSGTGALTGGTIFALNLVPEPSSTIPLGIGAMSLLLLTQRKRRRVN